MASHRVTYTAMPQTPLREVIKHFSRNFDCGPGASWRFIMDGEALPMVGSGPSLRRLADCEIEDGDVLDAEANEVEDNKAEDEIEDGDGDEEADDVEDEVEGEQEQPPAADAAPAPAAAQAPAAAAPAPVATQASSGSCCRRSSSMIRSWFGLWCHTNGLGDGGFKGGMKGPLCAHQFEGCTVTHTSQRRSCAAAV